MEQRQCAVVAERRVRNETLDGYALQAINSFEKGWAAHEKKLKKHLQAQNSFEDWSKVKIASRDDPLVVAARDPARKERALTALDGLTPEERHAFLTGGAEFYWLCHSTGERTTQTPAKKLFNKDRKVLRKLAEAKF